MGLRQIGSALIIDDSAFTKDSINPKTNKEKVDGALENFRSEKRESIFCVKTLKWRQKRKDGRHEEGFGARICCGDFK
ncbi:hypothetical protein ACFX2J_032541 [Malus domestica]